MKLSKRRPLPPKDVRLVLPDKTEVVCGVEYMGLDEQGCHLWTAFPIEPINPVTGIYGRIGTLPARTAVQFVLAVRRADQ